MFKIIKRYLNLTVPDYKQIKLNKTIKGTSSNQWLLRQLKDPYVEKAKILNYRCRSAFKLIEINEKFNILQPGQIVIDCGASPGSWSQVAVKKTNSDKELNNVPIGKVISIDRQSIYPIKGAIILNNLDFTTDEAQKKIIDLLNGQKVSVVLSDMAPNASGIRDLDQENITNLCKSVLKFALIVSGENSTILMKLWQCQQLKQLQNNLQQLYDNVKIIKPLASRLDSAEIFLLGRNFKGEKTNK